MKRAWTLSILFLAGLWAVSRLSAGFLPLWFDMPKRDNPNDPFAKRSDSINPALPSPTPVPLCGGADSAYWHFESSNQNWSGATASIYYDAMSTVLSPSVFCKGAQSLQGTVTFTSISKTTMQITTGLPFVGNFTGKTIQAWLRFPPGLPAGSIAKLYIKTTGGYVFAPGPIVNAPLGGGWMQLSLDVATAIATSGGNAALTNELGVEIYSSAPGGPFSFNLDSVEILPPPPTATPSPTALGTFTYTRTPSPTALGTFTATPTPSPSPTPVPTCGGASDTAYWNFEATQQGWAGNASAFYDPMTVTLSGSPICMGSQSLQGVVTFTAGLGKAAFEITSGLPFSGDFTGKVITAWVRFPSGLPGGSGGKFFIKTGAGYTFREGAWINAPGGGGWVLVTFNPSTSTPAPGAAINDVRELGLEIYTGAAGGPFTFNLDTVDIQ